MNKLVLASALALTIVPTAANANNTLPASDLLLACTTPDIEWVNFCNGFFQAAHDAAANAGRVCVPSGVSRADLATLYQIEATKLIANDRSVGGISGVSLSAIIFEQNFPCG